MTMKLLLVAARLGTTAPLPAFAAPADVGAAVARSDRPPADIKLDASRRPAAVLRFLGLRKGDRALDVMAGSGYYSEIMARAVGPKGVVLAFEPTVFAQEDKAKATWVPLKGRVPNVALLVQMPAEISLAPNSLDFTLMHLVYHDLYWESAKYKFPRLDPAAFLSKLHAATKPGGIVGVVDHVGPAGDTRATVDRLHRIDPDMIKADFQRAGFLLEAESDLLRTPSDDIDKLVFDPAVRGKTDRVIYRFRKPA